MGKLKELAQEKNENKTKVIFRKFSDNSIIAMFPELPGTNNANTCLNYMSTGQHGAGSADIGWTKPASLNEALPLVRELISIGYNLQIVSRFTHAMYLKRANALRAV